MIQFDDVMECEDSNTITYYFKAPKEMLLDDYPDALYATISIEVPIDCQEARYASVCISPTREFEDDGIECTEDYDWCDYDMWIGDVERLLDIAEEAR